VVYVVLCHHSDVTFAERLMGFDSSADNYRGYDVSIGQTRTQTHTETERDARTRCIGTRKVLI